VEADVGYLYDADGSINARTKTATDGTKTTRYFFYFGLTKTLAEEAVPVERQERGAPRSATSSMRVEPPSRRSITTNRRA
jgi:hypothetical protein